MFTVSSVCDEEEIVPQYGEVSQSVSSLQSHDLEGHTDLVTGQGRVTEQTNSQNVQSLSQSDSTNIHGSYVSLLADTATIDRTDEFPNRQLEAALTETIQYSVPNFSGKESVQDIVSGTSPTSLQNDPLITYDNQTLGYNLSAQPSSSQCLPQFVIFQNFGSSVISPSDGNNVFLNIPNSVESQLIESNKELEDAVANISDSTSVINQSGGILASDQNYLVSTNNEREIQSIQIAPTIFNDQNNSNKASRKQRTPKVVKKRTSQQNSKPKERSFELKKFSVDELSSEGKTKQELYEEFIGMTELEIGKKKSNSSKNADIDGYRDEIDDTNETVADVIHVRIEKPPDLHEQLNECTSKSNESILSNETNDNTGVRPIDRLNEKLDLVSNVKSEALGGDGSVVNGKPSVSIDINPKIQIPLESKDVSIKTKNTADNVDGEILILEGSGNDIIEDTTSEEKSKTKEVKQSKRTIERSGNTNVQVQILERKRLKRKHQPPMKADRSSKRLKKEADSCNSDLEGRMLEDFCRLFKKDDKCILKLKPVTIKLMKPNKQLVIEVHVENNIQFSSISQSLSSDGFVKHCMHFEESTTAADQGEIKQKVKENQLSKRKKKSMKERIRQKSPKFTSLSKNNSGKLNVNKQKNGTSDDVVDANVSFPDCNKFNLDVIKQDIVIEPLLNVSNSDVVKVDNDPTDECDDLSLNEGSTSGIDDLSLARGKYDSSSIDMFTGGGENMKDTSKQFELKKGKRKWNTTVKKQPKANSKKSEPSKDYIIRLNDEGHRIFSCPICGYSSRYPQNARKHIHEHTASYDWTCEICGLGFKSNNRLQKHRSIHQPDRPFSCRLCPKTFKSKGVLKQHLQRHLGLKHYVCEFCSKEFVTPGDLNKHRRCHTGDTPYHCDFCDKQYSDISAFHRHRKEKHGASKLSQCSVCSKQFPSQQSTLNHMKKVHGNLTGYLDTDKMLVGDVKPVLPILETEPTDEMIAKTETSVTIL